MLRTLFFGWVIACGFALSPFGSGVAHSAGFCSKFDGGAIDNWAPCASAPNIIVSTVPTGGVPASGGFLQLTDLPLASLACSAAPKYQGDWIEKVGGCGQLCFDFKIENEGYPPLPVRPYVGVTGTGGRTAFVVNTPIATSDGWVHICAPVNQIVAGQNLPSNAQGQWYIGSSIGYNPLWQSIISSVTQLDLPVDFTPQPSEIADYDNLCTVDHPCPAAPVVTGCLKDAKVTVKCNPDGSYTLTVNETGFPGTNITLTSETPGVVASPPQQPWAASTTWTLTGATPGEVVKLIANATQVGGGGASGADKCCSGEITIVMPPCPIDLKIEKQIVLTDHHGDVFSIKVSNSGVASVSFPAGTIKTTDNVPANMTVTSIGPSPWTCLPAAPPPIPGPAAIVCTYGPAVTLAPGAALPTINVTATTKGAGPWEECASVGVTSDSGHYDSNMGNNTSCVKVTQDNNTLTVVKKVQNRSPFPIPTTTVYPVDVNCGGANTTLSLTDGGSQTVNNIASGTSCTVSETPPTLNVCPGGFIPHWTTTYSPSSSVIVPPSATVVVLNVLICEQPKVCLKPLVLNTDGRCVCPAPSVPGLTLNQCVCPQGQQMVNGACVTTVHACKPPLVLNAAGECLCPTGTHIQEGACLNNLVACKAPLVPNAVGSCACPRGSQSVNGVCVDIVKACRPPLVLNDAGQCVKRPVVCGPNMTPNGVGGCVCRTGMTMVRGVCLGVTPSPTPNVTHCPPPSRLDEQGRCEAPLHPLREGFPKGLPTPK